MDAFLTGDLPTAKRTAQQNCRYLLVYLRSDEHPHCRKFRATLNTHPALQQLIADRFLVWTASVDTPQGYDEMVKFGATTFPFVAVCVKQRIIATVQGNFAPDELITELNVAMDTGAEDLAEEVAFRKDREEREALRQQQEQQLAEAMKHDAARAAAKQREREAEAQRKAEEARREAEEAEARRHAEEEARKAAEEAERHAAEVETRKAMALSALPDEPPEDAPANSIAQIKLVNLDGSSSSRRFALDSPVAALFTFAQTQPVYDGEAFKLVTGFPPKALDREEGVKISDVKALYPRSVVTMRAADL